MTIVREDMWTLELGICFHGQRRPQYHISARSRALARGNKTRIPVRNWCHFSSANHERRHLKILTLQCEDSDKYLRPLDNHIDMYVLDLDNLLCPFPWSVAHEETKESLNVKRQMWSSGGSWRLLFSYITSWIFLVISVTEGRSNSKDDVLANYI